MLLINVVARHTIRVRRRVPHQANRGHGHASSDQASWGLDGGGPRPAPVHEDGLVLDDRRVTVARSRKVDTRRRTRGGLKLAGFEGLENGLPWDWSLGR